MKIEKGREVDKKEAFFSGKKINSNIFKKKKDNKQKKKKLTLKKKILLGFFVLFISLFSAGFLFAYKTGNILNRISNSENSNIGSFLGVLSAMGINKNIAMDDQGRTNVLLLGMRGEELSGGGLLADTIMVASLKLDQTGNGSDDKISLISIPRDLYIKIPETNQHNKINYVYFHGEKETNETGISSMKKITSEITGLDIHYGVAINFKGFEELVDAVDGVEIDLSESFVEPIQFHEMKVCNGDIGGVFTVKTGEFEHKKDYKGKIVASYPLCYNRNEECGGIFSLPSGKQTLNGEKALCYVRSRKTSNDFDRARRQQLILNKLKEKMISLNTFSDFSKVNKILNSIGDNVRTDMNSGQMKNFFDSYSGIQNATINQKVLENSEEGLLRAPTDYPEEVGYILIPQAGQDVYTEIQKEVQKPFNPNE